LFPALIAALNDLFSSAELQSWLGSTGHIALLVSLVLLCSIAWLTNLISLPGNWICVLLIALYAYFGPSEGRTAVGVATVVATFVLALVGELIEFVAGAYGAKRAGASRKSTLYSIIGSIAGATVGAIVGVPIPLIGSLVAAIAFGGLGAAAGAMYGEWTDGRAWKENWLIGQSTFWGRTFGTLGKFGTGLVMLILLFAALVL
jgi:uncharacterized protein YqgC (DUF456 family)